MATETSSGGGVNTVAVVAIFALVVLIGGWFLMRGGLGGGKPATPNVAPAPSYDGGPAPGGNPPVGNPPPGGDNPAPQPPPANP